MIFNDMINSGYDLFFPTSWISGSKRISLLSVRGAHGGHCGGDLMEIGFTTTGTCAISAHHH